MSDGLSLLSPSVEEMRGELARLLEENQAQALRLAEVESELASARDRFAVDLKTAQQAATLDAMTGLPNRRAFEDRIGNERRRVARGGDVSLAVLDLDFFKSINDVGGHAAGDEVLRRVGAVLGSSVLRDGDFAARIGGEEFAIILPGTTDEEAARIGERIRAAIEAAQIPRPDGGIVTASVGVASASGSTQAGEDLFGAADRALYAAKHLGRNRVVSDDDVRRSIVQVSDNPDIGLNADDGRDDDGDGDDGVDTERQRREAQPPFDAQAFARQFAGIESFGDRAVVVAMKEVFGQSPDVAILSAGALSGGAFGVAASAFAGPFASFALAQQAASALRFGAATAPALVSQREMVERLSGVMQRLLTPDSLEAQQVAKVARAAVDSVQHSVRMATS